jgi:hypothetical protein
MKDIQLPEQKQRAQSDKNHSSHRRSAMPKSRTAAVS